MKNIFVSALILVLLGVVLAPSALAIDWGVNVQIGDGGGTVSGGVGTGGVNTIGGSEIPSADDTILQGGATGIIGFLNRLANWLFTILLILAVIFIILAAYQYLISGGGEGVGKAHKMLIYAVVALIVAFLAKGIVYVVAQLVSR